MKFKDESKVFVFYFEYEGFLECLRKIISSYVENVIIKKFFYLFFKKVYKFVKEFNKVIF